MNAALGFLHLQGIKILSYLDDWLICAPSHESVAESTALTHINTQGLTVINECVDSILTLLQQFQLKALVKV
jgi:hypothetical protein